MELPIPDHVPPHLVFDFDIYTAPELDQDPHRTMVERCVRHMAGRNGAGTLSMFAQDGRGAVYQPA